MRESSPWDNEIQQVDHVLRIGYVLYHQYESGEIHPRELYANARLLGDACEEHVLSPEAVLASMRSVEAIIDNFDAEAKHA